MLASKVCWRSAQVGWKGIQCVAEPLRTKRSLPSMAEECIWGFDLNLGWALR